MERKRPRKVRRNSILGRRGPVGLKRRSETHEANASVHAEKMGAFDPPFFRTIRAVKTQGQFFPRTRLLNFFSRFDHFGTHNLTTGKSLRPDQVSHAPRPGLGARVHARSTFNPCSRAHSAPCLSFPQKSGQERAVLKRAPTAPRWARLPTHTDQQCAPSETNRVSNSSPGPKLGKNSG